MNKVEGSITWYDLAWVLWLGGSLIILENLVHEAGHLSWLLLFRYEGPVTYHVVWLGQTYTGTLPTLGLLPVTNYWLIVPGLLSGGFAAGAYWLYVTHRLHVGSGLWILAPLTNFLAGTQFVYAIVEAVRNYPSFSNPTLWNSPELVYAPLGFLLGVLLLPRWVKARIRVASNRFRIRLCERIGELGRMSSSPYNTSSEREEA